VCRIFPYYKTAKGKKCRRLFACAKKLLLETDANLGVLDPHGRMPLASLDRLQELNSFSDGSKFNAEPVLFSKSEPQKPD